MLSLFSSLLLFLIAIMSLVMIHELGHYWVARYFGIKVLCVSIGFGKPLWRHQGKNGTEYVIAPIPLGGYVRLLDEREGEVAEEEQDKAFNRQGFLIRAAVICAGPLTNFLLAILLYGVVLGVGITHVRPVAGYIVPGSIAAKAGLPAGAELKTVDGQSSVSWVAASMAFIVHLGDKIPVIVHAVKDASMKEYRFDLSQWNSDQLGADWFSNMGIEPAVPSERLVVQYVNPYKPGAAGAGIKAGDILLAIQDQPITDRMMFLRALKPYAGQAVRLTFEREGRRLHAMTRVGQCASWRGIFDGYVGMTFAPIHWPPEALSQDRAFGWMIPYASFQKAWEMAVFNVTILSKLVRGELSFKILSGPIGIFAGSMMALKEGIIHYLNFLALLSIGLGIINLVPIPGLDGSRLLYLLIEKGRGRPLAPATENLIFRLGFIVLVVLLIQITIGDILRFIQMGGC